MFPALLDWSGFLINSHDPLRGHVLKHIRQNSLTSPRYSVTEQGNKKAESIVRAMRTIFIASVAHATLILYVKCKAQVLFYSLCLILNWLITQIGY